MVEDPVIVDSIAQEREFISQMICDCGGSFVKKDQCLIETAQDDEKGYLDKITVECGKCGKEKEIFFDVTDVMQGQPEPGEEDEEEQALQAGIISDEEAPFPAPYQQLMDIYESFRDGGIDQEEALFLLQEGKYYLLAQLKEFETDERVRKASPALGEANDTVRSGLELILRAFEALEGRIASTGKADTAPVNPVNEEYFKKMGVSPPAGEIEWEDMARDGNDLISQGKEKILKL